ncbi:hypothetical protein ACF3NT_02675 [Naumannella halotolerans]|uniref:Mercuric ion transport protein n=1 Tax=Naumannella halotolerans TaxID=993414 RepID=A0A4R7J9B6_9ACTN|nr:hypothetical protein [Naumannella halotolerans]TDT32969.1 hypothetical protein CLV29_0560 [Naumannella halotolerans]
MTRPDDRRGGGLLVAAGGALLVALCCGLPLILAGGALAGIGGLLRSPWTVGAGIAVVLAVAAAAIARRHRRTQDADCCSPQTTRSAQDAAAQTRTEEDENR